jgi:ABC-type nitrate/sulfonate/bicarbonate transport system ATPase subunit
MQYTLGNDLLRVEDVSLNFGTKKVLRDINLVIKNIQGSSSTLGQVVTILGRSGVGKTQLFKIIAGLLKPTSGQVLVGQDLHPVSPGVVGMVLQTYPLFAHRTLLGNLELVCSNEDLINEYLNEFDIYDSRFKYPKQLSGGQRQRTAIVQQLLCSSGFILLDEPFSGLDPVATDKLCRNISKVANHSENNTVIISSHILEPSLAISDSVYMLGHEVNNTGDRVEGAVFKSGFDLAANGLAWNPEIRKDPRFSKLVEDIRAIFQTL